MPIATPGEVSCSGSIVAVGISVGASCASPIEDANGGEAQLAATAGFNFAMKASEEPPLKAGCKGFAVGKSVESVCPVT